MSEGTSRSLAELIAEALLRGWLKLDEAPEQPFQGFMARETWRSFNFACEHGCSSWCAECHHAGTLLNTERARDHERQEWQLPGPYTYRASSFSPRFPAHLQKPHLLTVDEALQAIESLDSL